MEYLLKASAVICLFYLLYFGFLKKETFFQHNRWFLLTGLFIALIFPFVAIPIYIPIEVVTTTPTQTLTEAVSSNIVKTQPQTTFNWTTLLPIIYIIGCCASLFQFMFQFGSLASLLLKNPKNRQGIYTYVIVKNKISPFSFFKWIVYNPKSFDDDELELILTHEKVHVNQWHSIDILLMQLACAIFWFNPLIWQYRKAVSQNLEYIADNKTQTVSNNKKEYQHLLLKTSITSNHYMSLSNNFYNSQIKKRIIMLHKSKSKSKKQWRYLFIIPLLAGLLMSMNTKKVYVESDYKPISTTNHDEIIEFIVTKNTTDNELKLMSKAIEEKGGTLIFSQIKRNSKMELTSIFLKLNNHSYGGDSRDPIEPFLIYKEFFGERGGYVGRINGATLHFDEDTYNKKSINELTGKAHKAILKLGIQDENGFKEHKTKLKKQSNDDKLMPQKSIKKHKTTQPSNNKHLAMTQPKVIQNQAKILGNLSITVIDKNTTDSELENIKKNLKKEGLVVKFKRVKRNNKGEITAIKLEVKSKDSNANYNTSSDEAIRPIKIIFDEENNNVSISNGHTKHGEHIYTYATHDGDDYKIYNSGSGSNVLVISDDNHSNDAKIIVKSNGQKGKVKKVRTSSNVQVISGKDDNGFVKVIVDEDGNSNEDIIVTKGKKKRIWVTRTDDKDDAFVLEIDGSKNTIIISDDNGKNPVIIIDDKEVSKNRISEIDTDKIESITVLKNENAIAKYGDKAKDGVIIIKTKKTN